MHKRVVVYCNGRATSGILIGFNGYLNVLIKTSTDHLFFRNYDVIKVNGVPFQKKVESKELEKKEVINPIKQQ